VPAAVAAYKHQGVWGPGPGLAAAWHLCSAQAQWLAFSARQQDITQVSLKVQRACFLLLLQSYISFVLLLLQILD